MAEAPVEPPIKTPCWPNDPDWLDGPTEIELPSAKYLRAYWDADILDIDDKNPRDKIIEREDVFKVRFRVELDGRLWWCICGNWCFDIGFTPIGVGTSFNLSGVLPDELKSKLRVSDWKGCQTRCIYVCLEVPPCTIPVGYCGTLYDVGAKFELRCCGYCDDPDSRLAVAGYENLKQYLFV